MGTRINPNLLDYIWTVMRISLLALTLIFLTACTSLQGPDKALIAQAESGDIHSQFALASAYDTGAGLINSGSNAKKWYLKAANGGHAEAQNSLGSIAQAEGNYANAIIWYQKAAKQQHALASNNLAYLYDLGLGVKQDRQKGHDLYLIASDLGSARAMFNLANMFGAGQLGRVDFHQAAIWCQRSYNYAEDKVTRKRASQCMDYLKTQLSYAKLQKAKEIGRNWSPTKISWEKKQTDLQ